MGRVQALPSPASSLLDYILKNILFKNNNNNRIFNKNKNIKNIMSYLFIMYINFNITKNKI